MSVNAMANEVAVFNCTAIAYFINWLVNDDPADDGGFTNITNQELNSVQNIRSSTLHVQSLPEYNGYEIKCLILLGDCYEISMPAVFNVFGKITYTYYNYITFLIEYIWYNCTCEHSIKLF